MADEIITKRCPKCKTEKPISEFYRDKTRSDKLAGICKQCCKQHKKRTYALNKLRGPFNITKKICSKCDTIKDISEFHLNPSNKNGYSTNCKRCHYKQTKKYQQSKEGRKAQYGYNHNDKSRKRRRRYKTSKQGRKISLEYYYNNKEKYQAHSAVAQAIKKRILPHPSEINCECGEQAIEYHHWSYNPEHWLDVVPVCQECHTQFHNSTSPTPQD